MKIEISNNLFKINQKPRAVDLFAGAGGMSEALNTAGFNVQAAIEYNNVFASTYEANHGPHVWVDDICQVDCSKFAEKYKIIPRDLDLLAGCSPCQGFSKQFRYKNQKKKTDEIKQELLENEVKMKIEKEEDPRNLLVFEYLRFVEFFAPKYILFENVPGIQSHPWIFKKFIAKLKRKRKNFPGYHIYYDTINAADYGIPQRRKRFVLLGKRRDIYDGKMVDNIFPKPTNVDPNKINQSELRVPWVTLGEVIKHLPPIEAGETHADDTLHFSKKISDGNKLRLECTPKNGGSRKDWPQHLWLSCHQSDKENVGYGDVYGRMRYDTVSSTLTGGCLSIAKGRFAHPEQNRAISAREAAIIQTFPPKYTFHGTKEQIAMQIGNAVPVKMGYAFAWNILQDIQLITEGSNDVFMNGANEVDKFSKEKRSDIMSKVKPMNSEPELFVRKLLHKLGFRFRLHRVELPGKPDIVLPKYKKVIFIHGCYWHGHKYCKRSALPETNREFWEAKIERNIERDQRNKVALQELGWDVLELWGCEISQTKTPELVDKLGSYLKDSGGAKANDSKIFRLGSQ